MGGVVHLETSLRTRLLDHLPKQINHKNQRLLIVDDMLDVAQTLKMLTVRALKGVVLSNNL